MQSCAQVIADGPDAGLADPPAIASVEPGPGPIPAEAEFRVVFSNAMDLALLLAAPGRSETVVLVPADHADLVAAALLHGRLTAAQRALLVPALADVSRDARDLSLLPAQALVAGDYSLLVSSRLKDVEGRRILGNGFRYEFSVASSLPAGHARLEAPRPGTSVPANLQRVHLSFPDGPPAGQISLMRLDGGILAGPATSDGGPMALALDVDRGGADCTPLCPGAQYAIAEDGAPLPGKDFSAADCTRSDPPRWIGDGPALTTGDSWVDVRVELDWPGVVHLEARPELARDGGIGDERPAESGDLLVACAQNACGSNVASSSEGAHCVAQARLRGLAPGARYVLQALAADDEGNQAEPVELRFSTLGALPSVVISEVMASPPPPSPRSDGEYIEILNAGSEAVELTQLALVGADDRLRDLVGKQEARPPPLGPGERALAVGASFDSSRYSLAPSVSILRGSTQRLLGRGLPLQPLAIRLVWRGAGGDSQLELDRYPGGGPRCPKGASLERSDSVKGGVASFRCGAVGGSPGRAP